MRPHDTEHDGAPARGSGRMAGFMRGVAGVAIGLIVFELGCRLALPVASAQLSEPILTRQELYEDQSERIVELLRVAGTGHMRLHPTLGWRYAASYTAGDSLNSVAARGLREYARALPTERLRILAFGDSFVYGSGVGAGEAWPALLEATAPVEAVNFGVGGYGVDQALLRHGIEKGRLNADVVLIGFAPVDLGRVVNVYRRFRSNQEFPLTKPRFRFDEAGALALLPPPASDSAALAALLEQPDLVTRWGVHDYWYDPIVYENPLHDRLAAVRLARALWTRVHRRLLDPDRLTANGRFRPESEAFRIQLGLFDAFADSARAAGSVPIIIFLPGRSDAAGPSDATIYAPLRDSVAARGLTSIDLVEAFHAQTIASDPFLADGHYSPEGNALVARWLDRELGPALDAACAVGPGPACERIGVWRAAR